jgi:rhodanese-related sulfurtransferase
MPARSARRGDRGRQRRLAAARGRKLREARLYTDVFTLTGGVQAWADAGYEIYTGRQRAEQGVR